MSNVVEQHHLCSIDDRARRQAGISQQGSSTKLSSNNSHSKSFGGVGSPDVSSASDKRDLWDHLD